MPQLDEDGIAIVWTKRLIKGWYAEAHYGDTPEYGHGLIRVNVLLDSPDVSRDTKTEVLAEQGGICELAPNMYEQTYVWRLSL